MKTQKLITLIVLALTFATCIFAQKAVSLEELRKMNKNKKAEKSAKKDIPKDMNAPRRSGMSVELKEADTIVEGSYSKIETPFIYVARTKEDYEDLSELIEGFSSDREVDFNKEAVVAAFGGMKSSGGYSIQIYNLQGRTNVLLKSPPKDAVLTQAITFPYKVAVVKLEEQNSLDIAFSKEFESSIKEYKVTDGQFEFEGGFIGMHRKFKIDGTIGVMKSSGFLTYIFDLKGEGENSNRNLSEIASAKVSANSDSSIYQSNINRLEAGNFINKPHPPLIVSAEFKDSNLNMTFDSGKRDYVISDGFTGRGKLNATIVEPEIAKLSKIQ